MAIDTTIPDIKNARTAAALAFAFSCISVTSVQASLSVTDGSFENNTSTNFTGDGVNNNYRLDDWFEGSFTSGNQARENAEQALIEGGNRPLTDDGDYWGHFIDNNLANQPEIYQNLGTWNTGDTTSYNFSMTIGDRSNQSFSPVSVSFYSVDASDLGVGADGTLFADAFTTESLLFTSTTGGLDGGASTATAEYSVVVDLNDLSAVQDGDEVWVVISQTDSGATQYQSLIDGVNVSIIPEPSSAAMLLGAFSLLFVVRRRRVK